MSGAPSQDIRQQYTAMVERAGLCELRSRTQIEIQGRDRAVFFHGMCTNDIKRLAPGMGCEAFLTTVQGRTLSYVYVFSGQESLVLETAPAQASTILPSLERYLIREDVQLHNRSDEWAEFLLSGQEAPGLLQQCLGITAPPSPLQHTEVLGAAGAVSVRRVPFAGKGGFFISSPRPNSSDLRDRLLHAGAVECGIDAMEILRIEAGSPVYGVDVTDRNLPQEIDRNDLTISFTKGCYLGQETIARADALGHMNRRLMGLQFPSDQVPPAGTCVEVGGKTVATVTSAAWSYQLQSPLAMAYVRRGDDVLGRRIPTRFGEAVIVAFPRR